MPDPISHAGGVLGLKFATLLAGFFGGVVSLSFVNSLTKTQAALAVFTGTMTAGYGSPIATHYLGIVSPELQNGVAFVVGITAMNIIPGVIKLSEVFKRDPRAFVGGGKK